MIRTLQLYVTRELLKIFALTAIGLTLTFSLCGGVLNMIEAEVLTAVEMFRFLGFVLPVATTLTLPVAALFACAMVYGRLAADNEFDACRASGLNIHRLLAPAMGLSIATAAFTFTFTNYVIPNFIERLEAMVRRDIQKVVIQALTTQGYIRRGQYVLYAGDPTLRDDPASGAKVIDVRQAAFLELEKDDLVRCGTADRAYVYFWPNTEAGNPLVEAALLGVRGMDIKRDQVYEAGEQSFDSVQIPSEMEQEPKWLTLPQLLHYQKRPLDLLSIRQELSGIRRLVREALFFRHVYEQLTGPEMVFRIQDNRHRYEIRARRAGLHPKDFRPELHEITAIHWWNDERGKQRKREYRADQCSIKIRRGLGEAPEMVYVSLTGNVTFTDSQYPDQSRPEPGKHVDLDPVVLPAHVVDPAENRLGDLELLGLRPEDLEEPDYGAVLDRELEPLSLGAPLERARDAALKEFIKLHQEIAGIIHSRLAFSVSVLVTLVLAAALGIIFRGGQLLTAFVISFIPGLLVVVMNIMGRQLSENTGTHLLGIIVIWAGIGLLALADGVVLTRYLRR